MKIRKVHAREVLDSRGFPTVEVELSVDDPRHPGELTTARAIVPSGASTGEGEALELRDGDKKRYVGKGVLKAVSHVREKIAPAIVGRDFANQALLDDALRDLDGTPFKKNLGANAILPVSMAFARAQAQAQGIPSYRMLASLFGSSGTTLPVPLMNILNGGKHADNGLAIQEFMIVPAGFPKFSEALRAGAEVFHRLKKILHDKGLSTGVGDEGGFAPVFEGDRPHEQAITAIMQAITDAGYKPGSDIYLALDCAASEFCDENRQYNFEGKKRSAKEMVALYSQWVDTYPIISIEDGLSEHDWEGWAEATRVIGPRCQLVGDDLFVTNPAYLKKGIEAKTANAILIKLNQIGTVTETLETMKMAAQAGYSSITSHRSGESEDTFISELAVATDCGQIKTGSASRTDRIAKYNQLLRIEEELGDRARFVGKAAFRNLKGK
ncbi:MAG: phosphopyruvate hydratase [Oligoflexia bacterium]|nr:phosphopyruvate hydratase [Oligoflexia bacterium]